jgi:hypothetical protein
MMPLNYEYMLYLQWLVTNLHYVYTLVGTGVVITARFCYYQLPYNVTLFRYVKHKIQNFIFIFSKKYLGKEQKTVKNLKNNPHECSSRSS